jgi:uncharacterized protein YhfF
MKRRWHLTLFLRQAYRHPGQLPPGAQSLKKIIFWGRDENDDTLVDTVLRGEKTVTCSHPAIDYGAGEELTMPGDLVEVLDGRGNSRCVIRIDRVYQIPFGAVTDEIVKGECEASMEEFRADHHLAWDEDLAKKGMALDDSTVIIVEHFTLVR